LDRLVPNKPKSTIKSILASKSYGKTCHTTLLLSSSGNGSCSGSGGGSGNGSGSGSGSGGSSSSFNPVKIPLRQYRGFLELFFGSPANSGYCDSCMCDNTIGAQFVRLLYCDVDYLMSCCRI